MDETINIGDCFIVDSIIRGDGVTLPTLMKNLKQTSDKEVVNALKKAAG